MTPMCRFPTLGSRICGKSTDDDRYRARKPGDRAGRFMDLLGVESLADGA